MTKNTPDEMIAAIQAFKAGKTVQYCYFGHQHPEWIDIGIPSWDFALCNYRAKPEPREWWVQTQTSVSGEVVTNSILHSQFGDRPTNWYGPIIKVREVLE